MANRSEVAKYKYPKYLWKVYGNGVVMPLSVTNLRDLPPPLSRLEYVEVLSIRFLAQQKHQPTVVDK